MAKKRRPIHVPWWKRKVYRGCDKTAYYYTVLEYLENGPTDKVDKRVKVVPHSMKVYR